MLINFTALSTQPRALPKPTRRSSRSIARSLRVYTIALSRTPTHPSAPLPPPASSRRSCVHRVNRAHRVNRVPARPSPRPHKTGLPEGPIASHSAYTLPPRVERVVWTERRAARSCHVVTARAPTLTSENGLQCRPFLTPPHTLHPGIHYDSITLSFGISGQHCARAARTLPAQRPTRSRHTTT